MESSNYDIKVYAASEAIDLAKVRAALGNLFLGSRPYGDADKAEYISVKRDPAVIAEAVRRLNAVGFETDED